MRVGESAEHGTSISSPRRTPGLVLAIVGSDGSGKSTLCRDVTEHLRALGPVDFIYFGSGDGASSWMRWPLVQVRRLLPESSTRRSRGDRSTPLDDSVDGSRQRSRPVAAARVAWALTLAWEKNSKLRSAKRARRDGRIVVCDRFPQAQVAGLMDGPLLNHWMTHRAGLRRAAAGWEARPYRRAEREPPDLVLRLVVDQSHAEQRRPEHDPRDLRRRRELVAGLRFDGATFGVIDLDATMSVEQVRLHALRAIDACRTRADTF